MIALGVLYWYGGRTFTPVVQGRKNITGLVIEADGLHTLTIPNQCEPLLVRVQRHGQPYPPRRMRARYRALRPQTKQARVMRRRIEELVSILLGEGVS